ncbi:MAG: GlsB/YeaQ/YmgE family stress response membrane protein, partial [Vicinamibacteria bacterium]
VNQEGKMNILWFAIIGIVAGWLAGQIMKGRGFGLVGNLVVGVIGAIVGGLLASSLGLGASGLLGALVIATLGAVVLLAVVGALKRA